MSVCMDTMETVEASSNSASKELRLTKHSMHTFGYYFLYTLCELAHMDDEKLVEAVLFPLPLAGLLEVI